ncbi:hypothetical protein CHUAL_007257 [Chamberlinius hualienensis]
MAEGGEAPAVLQLKVTLKNTRPAITRVIQVPMHYCFFQLHVAIVNAMQWSYSYLHYFEDFTSDKTAGRNPVSFGCPPGGIMGKITNRKLSKDHLIKNYFVQLDDTCEYCYGYYSIWKHEIKLENVIPVDGNRCFDPDRFHRSRVVFEEPDLVFLQDKEVYEIL